MKQHITASEWGLFMRSNEKGANKLSRYYEEYQNKFRQENYPNQFVTIDWEPVFVWFNIGRMIEFLDVYVDNFELRGGRMEKSYLRDIPDNSMVWHGWSGELEIEDEPVLVDALWQAVKEILEQEDK